MKKCITVALAASAMAVGAAGSASAGEITANGRLTPVHFHTAASICSFSGLNDAYVDPEKYSDGPDDTAHTQTPAGAGGRVVGFACNGSGRGL